MIAWVRMPGGMMSITFLPRQAFRSGLTENRLELTDMDGSLAYCQAALGQRLTLSHGLIREQTYTLTEYVRLPATMAALI